MIYTIDTVSVPIRGLFNLTRNRSFNAILKYCCFRPHQGII